MAVRTTFCECVSIGQLPDGDLVETPSEIASCVIYLMDELRLGQSYVSTK